MARARGVTANEGLTEAEIIAAENLVLDAQFLIQEILNERDLTRADLARMTGVSKARLTSLMSAGANPTLRTLAKIFTVLGENLQLGRLAAAREQVIGSSAWGEEDDVSISRRAPSGSLWDLFVKDYKVKLEAYTTQAPSNENLKHKAPFAEAVAA